MRANQMENAPQVTVTQHKSLKAPFLYIKFINEGEELKVGV